MSSRPRLDLTARAKKDELHPSLISNVENRSGFPSAIGFLDAEIVECDRFHVSALLMTLGV
jgi:hypothetical protein